MAWKVLDPKVKDEEVIDIIVEPSSGPLIPNFLEVISKEKWAIIKPEVIQKLIIQRKIEINILKN